MLTRSGVGPARIDLTVPIELKPALPTGLARKAVDTLGQWIVNDRFSPEAVMPTESQLAATLGVGRATVRDAVKVYPGRASSGRRGVTAPALRPSRPGTCSTAT